MMPALRLSRSEISCRTLSVWTAVDPSRPIIAETSLWHGTAKRPAHVKAKQAARSGSPNRRMKAALSRRNIQRPRSQPAPVDAVACAYSPILAAKSMVSTAPPKRTSIATFISCGHRMRERLLRLAQLHKWDLNACPMSSMAFFEAGDEVLGAWETETQVYFAPVNRASIWRARDVVAPRREAEAQISGDRPQPARRNTARLGGRRGLAARRRVGVAAF